MKLRKLYVVATLLLLSSPTNAQYSSRKTEADSDWIKLQIGGYAPDFYSRQKAFLKYRVEGLRFWQKFPEDVRKYDWLTRAIDLGQFLYYWKIERGDSSFRYILKHGRFYPRNAYSWPIDKNALTEWEAIYPILKKEFQAYCARKPRLKSQEDFFSGPELLLVVGELKSFLALSLNKAYRPNGKIDIQRLKELFIAIGPYIKNEKLGKPNRQQKEVFGAMGYAFLDCYRDLGLANTDLRVFFNEIKNCPYPGLRDWAIMKENLFLLAEEPLSLKHNAVDGRLIDLEQLRGKVVLVDFWATTCSSCIARMPAIKAVYDKYKDQGFEVISACLANNDELDRIKTIEEKIGADWPTLLIGKTSNNDSLGQQIWRKYGFWGVPQLLLLNKEGKLVMLNDKLRNGDFEPDVKKLLAENYNQINSNR